MDHAPPRVSVVMATYNRSNIIGHAIRSVLASSLTDWELIVVGDACTDDTEAVVAGFGDRRIRFLSMERNFGEQSGPNNLGVEMARGACLAFLNHDDFYFPDHLARSVALLEETGADLVYGIGLRIEPGGRPRLIGATTLGGTFQPGSTVPASLWVMRHGLADRIGPWRPARSLRRAPSEDWLTCAHRAGARLRPSHHLAALVVPAGSRKRSYADRHDAEHTALAARMREPDFPDAELIGACLRWESARHHFRPWPFFREGLRLARARILVALGILPPWREWRRGAFLERLRATRGLDPALPRPETSDNLRGSDKDLQ